MIYPYTYFCLLLNFLVDATTVAAGTSIGVIAAILLAVLILAMMVRRARDKKSKLPPGNEGLNVMSPTVENDFLAMHDLDAWEEDAQDGAIAKMFPELGENADKA